MKPLWAYGHGERKHELSCNKHELLYLVPDCDVCISTVSINICYAHHVPKW